MERQILMLSAVTFLVFGAAAQAIPRVADPGLVKSGLQKPAAVAPTDDGGLRVLALREP